MKNRLAVLIATAVMLASMPAWATHNHHKKMTGKHFLKHHNKHWKKHHGYGYYDSQHHSHYDKHRYRTRIYYSSANRYCPPRYTNYGHWGLGFSLFD